VLASPLAQQRYLTMVEGRVGVQPVPIDLDVGCGEAR